MKTSVSILGIGLLALSGCHRAPSEPTGPTAVTATSQGVVVSQARLVLPAVRGNPGAAYFTVSNQNGVPATLVRVDVAGAQNTEIHETSGGTMQSLARIRIDPGQQVIFAPAGKHCMVFSLAPALVPGGTGKIVLHFQDGTAISAPLRIEAAGGDMAGMAGMDMGGKP